MSDEKHTPVQLTGDEQKSMAEASAKVEELLDYIARVTFKKMGLEQLALGRDGILKITVVPGNTKQIFYDKNGHCAAVYENPPGICRPCKLPTTDGWPE
jgi:hypothetical protein